MSIAVNKNVAIGVILLVGAFDVPPACADGIYWSDGTRIRRAELDGSNVQDLVVGLVNLSSMALNVAAGEMYWVDRGANKIQRANLDGTDVQDLVTGLSTPEGLTVDLVGERLYWTVIGDSGVSDGKIQRANLDGSGMEDVVTGLWAPTGLAVDPDEGLLFWLHSIPSAAGYDKIQRANLDGSNVQDLLAPENDLWQAGNGLDVYPGVGRLYWTSHILDSGCIDRANYDGSEDYAYRCATFAGFPAIALDPNAGHIYYAFGGIWRDGAEFWTDPILLVPDTEVIAIAVHAPSDSIPTVSGWGMLAMVLLLTAGGTLIFRGHGRARPGEASGEM